jgi:hypothetical protein
MTEVLGSSMPRHTTCYIVKRTTKEKRNCLDNCFNDMRSSLFELSWT